MLQDESQIDTFIIGIEDVLLYGMLNNQELLLQQILPVLRQAVSSA